MAEASVKLWPRHAPVVCNTANQPSTCAPSGMLPKDLCIMLSRLDPTCPPGIAGLRLPAPRQAHETYQHVDMY